jgi:rSAM/selenodomain-associated transferase 1
MQSKTKAMVRSSNSDRVLVIMAKAPKGTVKTRLRSSLSPEAITDFYCCLLNDTLTLARSLTSDVEIAIMCPASDVNELKDLAGSEVTVVAQKGEGLAAGLTSVFSHFTEGQRRVVAFNSDSPHLPGSILEDAFEMLTVRDVVVGPTHDGGYYLIGAKAFYPALFANDGMGTSSALERLLARTRVLELSVGFEAVFYDIDVADDLTRLAAELRSTPARAKRTARWLEEWERASPHLPSGTGKP